MNYSLSRLTASRYQLRMQGPCYSASWMATLSSSLSALRIAVVEAHVSSEAPHLWTADFVLDFRGSQVRAEVLDYVALTRRKPTIVISEAPILQRFVLLSGRQRTLRIVVEADEQNGFQDRLLTRIAGLGLHPTQMNLRRMGLTVRYSLALRGIGGREPAAEAGGALESLLRRMQARREALPRIGAAWTTTAAQRTAL